MTSYFGTAPPLCVCVCVVHSSPRADEELGPTVVVHIRFLMTVDVKDVQLSCFVTLRMFTMIGMSEWSTDLLCGRGV